MFTTEIPGCAGTNCVDDFFCSNGTCAKALLHPGHLVQNPVFVLPQDNNGIFIAMDAVPTGGAPTATGTLIFGIGTSPANDPKTVLAGRQYVTFSNDSLGFFSHYNGYDLFSAVDTGSNSLFFSDDSIPQCYPTPASKYYCPEPSPTWGSLKIDERSVRNYDVPFQISDARYLIGFGNMAFNDLASPWLPAGPVGFILGLPFFYNRIVFIAYGNTPLGNAPTWGYAYGTPPYDLVEVETITGNDDAGSGTEITAHFLVDRWSGSPAHTVQDISQCLKPTSSTTGSWIDHVCDGSSASNSWSKGTTNGQSLHAPFAQDLATGSGNIDIKLLQQSCSSFCDNWNLQGIIVRLWASDITGPPTAGPTLLVMGNGGGGNCIAKLKAPPNATTVRFSLDFNASHVYVDGTSAEQGQTTTCKNNGG
jgi:hypothetical protein